MSVECLRHDRLDPRVVIIDHQLVPHVEAVVEKGLNRHLPLAPWGTLDPFFGVLKAVKHFDASSAMGAIKVGHIRVL